MLQPLKTLPLALVLADLSVRPERLRTLGDPPTPPHPDTHALIAVAADNRACEGEAEAMLTFAREACGSVGALLVFLHGDRGARELARLRNALWPWGHVGTYYQVSNAGIVRHTLEKTERLSGGSGLRGTLFVVRRREEVLAPDATVAKFDRNAAGWNGEPGRPGYAHFRWMRRYVGTFAQAREQQRILDFGCGTGWVGIEAALAQPAASLAAFDPSPVMIELAAANARANGIQRFEARTGFGEAPPFPAAGEKPFDLVLSSGVISFAPDQERWLDGLVSTLAPRATLVIGDLEPSSRGMQRRRAERPLLPVREMNARSPTELRAALERRGLRFVRGRGYQASWPVPQLMHWNERKLGGALDGAFVAFNRALGATFGGGSPRAFDSWVMHFERG